MEQDAARGVEETTIWSEVPDLRDKLMRLIRIQGLLDRSTIDQVADKSANGGGGVSQIILESELMSENKLIECLEKASGYPAVDPRQHAPAEDALTRFTSEMALRHRAFPLKIRGDRLFLVMENPNDVVHKQHIQETLNLQLEPYIFHTDGIFEAIGQHYASLDTQSLTHTARQEGSMRVEPPEEKEVTREETTKGLFATPLSEMLLSPVSEVLARPLFTQTRTVTERVRMPRGLDTETYAYSTSSESATAVVDAFIAQALDSQATDIHIEPMQDSIRIRIRRDAMLSTMNYLALEMHNSLINRIKVMSRLDLAERRKIQESSFRFTKADGTDTHFRVSVMPTSRGETAELRVIDGRQGRWDLAQLGMTQEDLVRYERSLYYPSGLILITGPTAAGKTTTLYSSLKRLNVEGRKIITAEDPIEYDLYGVTQVGVNEKLGLSYDLALKAFLRQDPDVLMLGEIRDPEAAHTAVGAAMTGHLVLAAVHTNDASSAPARLIQTLGVDPLLVCDSLLMTTGQRIIRLLCNHCKEPKPIDAAFRLTFGDLVKDIAEDYHAAGCTHCRNTGFAGVSAVFEVMDITPEVKELIFNGARTSEIFEAGVNSGMRPMQLNALEEVKKGNTSLAELKRVMMYKRLF